MLVRGIVSIQEGADYGLSPARFCVWVWVSESLCWQRIPRQGHWLSRWTAGTSPLVTLALSGFVINELWQWPDLGPLQSVNAGASLHNMRVITGSCVRAWLRLGQPTMVMTMAVFTRQGQWQVGAAMVYPATMWAPIMATLSGYITPNTTAVYVVEGMRLRLARFEG